MLVSTKNSDAIIRKALAGNKRASTTIAFPKMIEQFALDPNATQPTRQCYIVTNDDITSNREKQQFEAAAASKHVDTKIIFINKGSKEMYKDGCPGIDLVLQKPNDVQLKEALAKVISGEVESRTERELGAATIEHITQAPEGAGKGYKLSRERAKRPERRGRGSVSVSATGMPIVVVEGKQMFISQATDEDGTPVEPPKYYAVANSGEFMPTYPDGTPIECDEYGNILDPNIILNDDGEPVFDEDGVVLLQDIAVMETEGATTAEDVLTSNVNNLKTYDEVENESNQSTEGGADFFTPPVGMDIAEPTSHVNTDTKSNIAGRLEDATKVSDLSILLREMNASAVIKDLIQTNSTYYGIEEKLRAISDAVFVIMNDKSYTTAEERFNKIHALMHDRAFYNAQGNTLIEQLTMEIVDTIVTKATGIINKRIGEIDTAIKNSAQGDWEQDQPAKLAGLADERASIVVELASLEADIKQLMLHTDGFIKDVGNEIATRTDLITGDEDVDLWFKARGAAVTDAASVSALKSLLHLSADVPEQYKELEHKIKTEQMLLRKLLQIEEEIAEAQKLVIERMKSRGIEGKVVVQSTLKKTLNIFVGGQDVGKTIIPYLFAKYKSKQNAHVLLVNISKHDKFNNYGINTIPYDDFVTAPVLQDFACVKGSIADDVAAAQQFITVLTRSADYYKYIYVVLDDEQTNLFNVIAPDVFSVNYLVDTNPTRLQHMRTFIDTVNLENVAERIFINRCSVSIRPILDRLGKLDSIDYQICKVDEIPEIVDAGLSSFDPYGISSVSYAFEELHRHVKS